MVLRKVDMKRKRKELCPSPLLDDSPKRTKVHAQRKFAQGSNVNSPVITPIKELECDLPRTNIMPEPVELLPMKRPNTEDFLTFLCFRGTPILPPSLNFFNTASIVDTNGQVHEIKSESPRNGPIDVAKCGTSSEKPFIAFGVRKRADPIVISRQMDRKRRHALAIQALRRKYQEQKMAKIRALTISKLSEKTTNRLTVKTNTVSKTETVMKKGGTVQKTKVVATKHVKVTTQTLKTALRPKIKPKMCLRSFRGRFVQKELPFRSTKRTAVVSPKKEIKKLDVKKICLNRKKRSEEENKAENEETVQVTKVRPIVSKDKKKILKTAGPLMSPVSSRVTRSGQLNVKIPNKLTVRRQLIKKKILLSSSIVKPATIVKPKLRSTTLKKSVISQKKAKQRTQHSIDKEPNVPPRKIEKPEKKEINKVGENSKTDIVKKPSSAKKESEPIPKKDTKAPEKAEIKKDSKPVEKTDLTKKSIANTGKEAESVTKKDTKVVEKPEAKKDSKLIENKKEITKNIDVKKEITKSTDQTKKEICKNVNLKKVMTSKTNNKEVNKNVDIKKELKNTEIITEKSESIQKTKKEVKSTEVTVTNKDAKNETNVSIQKTKKEVNKTTESSKKTVTKKVENKSQKQNEAEEGSEEPKKSNRNSQNRCTENAAKKETNNKKQTDKETPVKKEETQSAAKKETNKKQTDKETPVKKEETQSAAKKETNKKQTDKETPLKKEETQSAAKKETNKKQTDKETHLKKEETQKDPEENNSKKEPNKKEPEENRPKKAPSKKEPEETNSKKEEQFSEKEETTKKKTIEKNKEKETFIPKTSQRPSRKTKEAAAIYMEILSHKLVSESRNDDDNISIDSFPELPNVKKTEQRENELKAQAKTKDDNKQKPKIDKGENDLKVQAKNKEDVKQTKKIEQKEVEGKAQGKIKSEVKQKQKIEEIADEDTKTIKENASTGNNVKEKEKLKTKEAKLPEETPKKVTRLSSGKRKSPTPELDSDDENLKAKIKKLEAKNTKVAKSEDTEEPTERRQTRNLSLNLKHMNSDDSDESFHIDVKIPRRKKVTRSKTKPLKTNSPINPTTEKSASVTESPKKATASVKSISKETSGSDQSTTSDINLKCLQVKTKNKKFSKTKPKKPETDFSDSDEEPLSKFTKSIKSLTEADKNQMRAEKKTKPVRKTLKQPVEVQKQEEKPKRECAKRPQNYLPMFSSSDDEEDQYFHGFSEKVEVKKLPLTEPLHVLPSLDLLSKDNMGRKGKVNMSNEQIEKWLKDSAMAGSSIKKENDAMLKFGEHIPTETSLDATEVIDTRILKASLLEPSKEKIEEPVTTPPAKTDDLELKLKQPQPLDRKLIFRKDKKEATRNVNAFSPENECSVYAFGEENEEVISTPFRRPSRRPSSTATSKSEDESSKHDDSLKAGQFRKPSAKQEPLLKPKDDADSSNLTETEDTPKTFNIPQNPSKPSKLPSKPESSPSSGPMIPPSNVFYKKPLKTSLLDSSDDVKYKIPSSPSASSSSSAKLYKRQAQKQKIRPPELITPSYLSDFPKSTDPAKLMEAPVFHPTDQEFQDPIEYIERIKHKAEQFGICRIVPPSSFKPECKVTDDMRFTAYNQYVHKMLHRWGPNFKELMAIKKYLATQNISLTHPPWIGGMEIDLPRLYQTVQSLGGLKEVIEKKKWPRVSECMKIPKSAQDRVTKLDDIYCKYLLPYDTLSPVERQKLFDEVETDWAKRESKGILKAELKIEESTEEDEESDDNETEECIMKGRNMALNAFYRIARNTMSMHFKTPEAQPQEVEQEFWKYVTQRQNHICVHSGSIDCGNWGYGFAVTKNSPFARHAWNLKVLTNNSGSVLRSLGPVMGVTVPTLHVGMVFSACCWYRDPHGLPWIEYLHTGGNKIWYGIPNSAGDLFHTAMKKLVPKYCRDKELWLPSDTAMVPPSLLVENNVSLCRTIQEPGQFVVVFPKAFTSSISTGYVVSESVYFAPPYWLKTSRKLFENLKNSCEPSMFSLDKLLLSISSDARSSVDVLRQVIPYVQELVDIEKEKRAKLNSLGNIAVEKLPLPEANHRRRKKQTQGDEGEYECDVCRVNLYVSMVVDSQDDVTYCLDHATELIEKNKQPEKYKLMFTYDFQELEGLVGKIKFAIEAKLQKKVPNKYAGMPTLLTK